MTRNINEQLIEAETAEQTKFLIEAGADVNAKDIGGKTALMNAQTVEQTKLLLEAGADVNAFDREGKTALMLAQTVEQTKLLLEAGADVTARDIDSKTALMLAETTEQVNLLWEAEADSDEGYEEYGEYEEIKQHIERRKCQILKSRKLRQRIEKQNPMAKVSDAAFVDEIAKDKISGKELRTITPEIGAEIKRRKAFEK